MASRKLLELALLNARADPSVANIKVYFQVAKSYWMDYSNTVGVNRDHVHYVVDYVNAQLDRIRKAEGESIPCGVCNEHPRHKINGGLVYIVCKNHQHGINREILKRVGCKRYCMSLDLKEAAILPGGLIYA